MSKIIVPKITGMKPTSGKAGDLITLVGEGFIGGNNIHGIFFGEGDAALPALDWKLSEDATTFTDVLVPEGLTAGSVPVRVRTEGGIDNFGGEVQISNAAPFTAA